MKIPILVLMVGSASGATQTLSIRLYDEAHARSGVLNSATDQASRLFRTNGIRIHWERPPAEPAEDQGSDFTAASLPSDTRGYLVVRLVRGMPASVLPRALGFALPFANHGAHIVIFYDRVEALGILVNADPGNILGHAIAHELGHVLLGSSEHSNGGLMQGRWGRDTLRLASLGLLVFRPEETARIRRLQAQKPVPGVAIAILTPQFGR